VRRFAPQLFAQLFCLPLIAFCAPTLQGQSPVPQIRPEMVQYREWALGNLRRDISQKQYQRQQLLAQAALKNDFRNLQIVNNELMRRIFEVPTNQRPSDKEIRTSLGEIKKLAKRLQLNFAMPEFKSEAAAPDVAMNPGLLLLDKSVMSFVENPLFQELRVYDPELATRASKDMSQILRLSEFLIRLTKERH